VEVLDGRCTRVTLLVVLDGVVKVAGGNGTQSRECGGLWDS
jgi:hypothetical protein